MNVGSDKVCVGPERLVILAAEPMDLPMREFCKVPVYFQGRKYYVRSKHKAERPHAMAYELWPWPTDLHESSTRQVIYDEAYVIERDKMATTRRGHERLHMLLLPVYPLLGLCWSGFKNRVLGRLGFEPGSITKASIFLTFSLFMADGVLVGWLASGILGIRAADWALLLLLGADLAMRFGQSLKFDVEDHWGFGEWLWPKRYIDR